MPHLPEPRPLDVGRAQAVLTDWAEDTALVDDRLFDAGVTRTDDATLMRCRLTRLVETRAEESAVGEGWRDLTEVTDWPALHAPETFDDHTFTFVVADSVESRACPDCRGEGEVECRSCRGRGKRSCPTERSCTSCGGSGDSGFGMDRTSCTWCGGSGRQRCPECNGFGSTRCSACLGSGTRTCRTCSGSGRLTHYDTLVARRRVVRHAAEPGADDSPVRLREDDWDAAVVLEPAALPDGLDEVRTETVRALLATRSDGEVLMDRLEVCFVPITAVAYRDGDRMRHAWLVGSDHRVVAPHATRGRRYLTWAAAAVVLVALVTAVVLLGG